LHFDVPLSDLKFLEIGQAIKLSSNQKGKNNQQVKIKKISSQAVEKEGIPVFPIVASADNSDDSLKANTNISIHIPLEKKVDALSVPLECIYYIDDETYLEKRLSDKTSKLISVQLGLHDEQWVEVISEELKEGDLILKADYETLEEKKLKSISKK
jgi:hypothetical protein